PPPPVTPPVPVAPVSPDAPVEPPLPAGGLLVPPLPVEPPVPVDVLPPVPVAGRPPVEVVHAADRAASAAAMIKLFSTVRIIRALSHRTPARKCILRVRYARDAPLSASRGP